MGEYLVSVIMPAHNAQETIAQSIESVLGQTYSNFELLIFDDGSSDCTREIIEKYMHDARISYYSIGKNVGVCKARNYLISKAKGRFIAFLDSDDLWLSHCLYHRITYMIENTVAFSFMDYSRMSYSGEVLSDVKAPSQVGYSDLLKSNPIGCLTVCIDRTTFNNFKFPELACSEDYALWLDLLRTGAVAYNVGSVGALYRLSHGSRSSNKFKTVRWQWRILRDREKLSYYHSIVCMFSYGFRAVMKRI